MESLTGFVYFLITCVMFWIVKSGKAAGNGEVRRYSRAEMMDCEGIVKTPEGFLTVESIRSSFGSRPTKFRGKINKSVNEKKNNENFKGTHFRDSEFLGTVRKNENKENKENRENNENKENKENNENFFNKNSSLSSFILKELENSVKELTFTPKAKKPVAPSGYTLSSLKSSTRPQPSIKSLNAHAQEYTIPKNY